jgi:hypothetical protein
MKRRWLQGGVMVGVVVTTLLVAQAAYASTLADAVVVNTSAAPASYTFSSVTPYWSVVAVSTSVDYDLALYDGSNNLLAASSYGTGVTDFIAVNSNLRALGSYQATVAHYAGAGSYYIQQRQGHTVTQLPIPANQGVSGPDSPDLNFAWIHSQDVASVSDIYFNAGDKFWVKTANYAQAGFFLLESNPADPSTFIRDRSQASAYPGTQVYQGCTLFTVHYTGWHGLLVINQDPPHATNPQQGIAYALDRFDPARPTTCPMRNFPDPTPPGP